MPIIEIKTLDTPGAELFSTLTDAQLRNKKDPSQGILIAESPKVIRVALSAGYEPVALMCERKHITGDAADLIAARPEMSVYTGDRDVLSELTGYTLTRGVLCAMRRPLPRPMAEILTDAKRIVVIDGVVDSTNIGAIFRSAAALGIDGALVTTNSCDPFNRRCVRVSMGTVFLLPWTWLDGDLQQVRSFGFKTVAMALTDHSIGLDAEVLRHEEKLAIVMGTEGDGLPHEAITSCDYVVKIPMYYGVDSLNVAAASAVAFWELTKSRRHS